MEERDDKSSLVEATDISLKEWEVFISSPFWGALRNEIEERDKMLMELLRYGDPEKRWSDGEIRSRINELEYLKTLPGIIILDISAGEKEKGDK